MPDWDMTSQSAPDYPDDQRTDWKTCWPKKRRLRRGRAMPAAQLCMSFVPMGGKTLGIQIAISGKARRLRTLFGAIVGLMRLNFLSFETISEHFYPPLYGEALFLRNSFSHSGSHFSLSSRTVIWSTKT